jgi:hypothetical protein
VIWLRRFAWAIAVITALSGLVQIVVPGWELDLLATENTATTRQLFATVGMFMLLFGGLMVHALAIGRELRLVLLWTSLQKFGAFAAVSLGVVGGVFSPLVMAVALFDLASGAVLLAYRAAIASDD